MELFLNEKLGSISYEVIEAKDPKGILILAHGAGAGMHHPFMVKLAEEIASMSYHMIRFNFPYMEKGRKAPGSPKDAIESWRSVVQQALSQYHNLPIFLSGKSYGGRMASHLLAEDPTINTAGIVYFGFPLHAPGRDSKDRAAHLGDIIVPQLFLQGTKDKLANIEMMKEVVAGLPNGKILEIENGDHSFNVPKSEGKTKDQMIKDLASLSTNWMKEVSS